MAPEKETAPESETQGPHSVRDDLQHYNRSSLSEWTRRRRMLLLSKMKIVMGVVLMLTQDKTSVLSSSRVLDEDLGKVTRQVEPKCYPWITHGLSL